MYQLIGDISVPRQSNQGKKVSYHMSSYYHIAIIKQGPTLIENINYKLCNCYSSRCTQKENSFNMFLKKK